eukprot:Pgem_evm1s4737
MFFTKLKALSPFCYTLCFANTKKYNLLYNYPYFISHNYYSSTKQQQRIENKNKETPKSILNTRDEKEIQKNFSIISSFEVKLLTQPNEIDDDERSNVFDSYLYCNLPDKAFEIYQGQEKALHHQQYHDLLKCYLKQNYKCGIDFFHNNIQGKDITVDTLTYNILIKGCSNNKRIDESIKYFQEMEERGISADVVTYNNLIDCCSKNNRFDLSIKYFQEMQQRGISTNIVTYTILMDKCYKNKTIDESIKYFQEMQHTYNSLIVRCSKNNRIDESIKYFQEMEQRGFNPDIKTYNSLIDGCSKKKRINESINYFLEMQEKGISPDIVTYNSLIAGCSKETRIDESIKYFQEIEER